MIHLSLPKRPKMIEITPRTRSQLPSSANGAVGPIVSNITPAVYVYASVPIEPNKCNTELSVPRMSPGIFLMKRTSTLTFSMKVAKMRKEHVTKVITSSGVVNQVKQKHAVALNAYATGIMYLLGAVSAILPIKGSKLNVRIIETSMMLP